MKLPVSTYTDQPWRIHEITDDFRVEDAWAFRTPGAGPADFPAMLAAMRAAGGPAAQIAPARFLLAVRWKLGALLGWDKPGNGPGGRIPSLRERLPADLRDGPRGPDLSAVPMTSVYETPDEWAAEMGNSTVHGIMHISWVPDESGGYRGQMAVLVKPNGRLGTLYMAAIKPFRYLGVYPALLRTIGHEWQSNTAQRTTS